MVRGGGSYMHSTNFRSEIYLKKGDQAYYKTEYTDNTFILDYLQDCQGETHGCTWLEIRRTGDFTVKDI